MNKKLLAGTIAAAFTLASSSAFAGTEHEKCRVVDDHGEGLIKAGKADCASENSSCAGQNKAGDPTAWILVPKGECAQINKGDFSGVPKVIEDKVEKKFKHCDHDH